MLRNMWAEILFNGVKMDDIQIEQFKGDGSQRTFSTTYPIGRIVEICIDEGPVSFGIKGMESGKQAYYAHGDSHVTFECCPKQVEIIYRPSWEAFFVCHEAPNVTVNVYLDGKAIASQIMTSALRQLKNR